MTAAAGGAVAPLGFTGLLVAAMLGQLLLEAFTTREGEATIVEPPDLKTSRWRIALSIHQ